MLDTLAARPVAAGAPFTITVPGHQLWVLRTVCAVCATAFGGTPARAFLLELHNGTSLVAASGAADAATDPADVTVTWANSASGVITAGAVGVSVAAFANVILEPGYVITGTVINGQPGDQWTSAVAWFDFDYTV